MDLYDCEICKAQFAAVGSVPSCPHCGGRERTHRGEMTIEDVNLLLEERSQLLKTMD
jgi:hypothetical protein